MTARILLAVAAWVALSNPRRHPHRPPAPPHQPGGHVVMHLLFLDCETTGVDPGDFDRHTAMGDARWAIAQYAAVFGLTVVEP